MSTLKFEREPANTALKSYMKKGSVLLAAAAFTVASGLDIPEDKETSQDRLQREINYINDKGCDGSALERGEIPYCPD